MYFIPLIFDLLLLIYVGPALVSAVGAFLSSVIFFFLLVLTAPGVLIYAGKDMRERDGLYDKIDAARCKYDFQLAEMYERHLKDIEERVNDKINVVAILNIIAFTIGSVLLYIFW